MKNSFNNKLDISTVLFQTFLLPEKEKNKRMSLFTRSQKNILLTRLSPGIKIDELLRSFASLVREFYVWTVFQRKNQKGRSLLMLFIAKFKPEFLLKNNFCYVTESSIRLSFVFVYCVVLILWAYLQWLCGAELNRNSGQKFPTAQVRFTRVVEISPFKRNFGASAAFCRPSAACNGCAIIKR